MKKKASLSFLKLFKSRIKIPINELETGNCQNCGYEFKGHYCPDCGQEVAEFNRPLGFVMYDFIGNFFAFDTRFFKTFKYLIFYPGFLTKEFFKGRRTRYSPPFRIFVFLSFVLFLILSFLSDRGLEADLNTEINSSSKVIQENIAVINEEISDGKADFNKVPIDSSLSEIIISTGDSLKLNFNLAKIFIGKGSIRERLDQLANLLESSLAKETDPANQKRIKKYILMCRTPEIALTNLLKYLSWASFLLLPLFALILKLFYTRRKQLYIRHLLFSIHLHSFFFIVLILVTLPWLLFNSSVEIINIVLIGSIPVYLIIALRKFYDQPWLKTIVKFFGIGFIYNIILSTVVLVVFLKSLQVF